MSETDDVAQALLRALTDPLKHGATPRYLAAPPHPRHDPRRDAHSRSDGDSGWLQQALGQSNTIQPPPFPLYKGPCERGQETAMLDALRERLLEKPGLYLEEMALFLWDEFGVLVSTHSISRTLRAVGWSKKVARQTAREQNAELRDFYLHNLTQFQSYHLVFIDESGCDKRIGFRRTGWSPLGIAPVQVAKFHRDRRYQILPAYTQDGILLSRVYQGSTDSAVFEDYIEQLLPHCGRWPEPKSVLVMDNASFHHTERLEQMCCDAGVKLMYLPPYSPDLNPIEEFFSELKAFIKKNWRAFEEAPEQGFDAFLEWCIDMVGGKQDSAKGHFRHAGITVEEY